MIDRWRRAGRRLVLVGDGPLEVPVRAVDPTTNDFTDEMQHALSQLPKELRESLLLVVVGELTHQETANALGVPLGTVLSRVSRARQRLRKHLVATEPRLKETHTSQELWTCSPRVERQPGGRQPRLGCSGFYADVVFLS